MITKLIKINPLDSLFFREARPFTKGEDTWANTIFPPFPTVFYGSLRSLFFAENIEQLKNAQTENDITQKLVIKNIYLVKNNKFYIPAPLDLFKDKNKKNSFYGPKYETPELTSLTGKLPCLTYPNISKESKIQVETVENSFIELSSFINCYAQKYYSSISIKKVDELILNDKKIGIKRSSASHSSEEGCLYRTDMLSMFDEQDFSSDISFYIEYQNLSFENPTGLMKLGGEGKGVKYQIFDEKPYILNKLKSHQEELFKSLIETDDIKDFRITFTSPAIFEKDFNFDSLGLALKSCCVGKAQSIGGFDIKQKRPKTMKKAVPAGSVYSVSISDKSKLNTLLKHSFSEKPQEGFGSFVIAL